jgi:hypothetical protein
MGQLNFFMTKEELVEEINKLLASDQYYIFRGQFFDKEFPEPSTNLDTLTDCEKIIIWVENNQLQPKCSSLGDGKYKGKFLFDVYFDPIIEVDIGRRTDKVLLPSRLFYKTGWLKDVQARETHTKMTNRIIRSFKKKLTAINRLKPFYLSQSILNLLDENFELELGEGGKRVTKFDLD